MCFCENTFVADAVLFDMDGTLTDSIAAVEAAWGKVANEIGADCTTVIAATHGKRAIDNLRQWKPHLKDDELEAEVDRFERTILAFADAYHTGPNVATFGDGGELDSSGLSSVPGTTPSLTDGSQSESDLTSSSSSADVESSRPHGHVPSHRPSIIRRVAERLSTLSTSSFVARFEHPFKNTGSAINSSAVSITSSPVSKSRPQSKPPTPTEVDDDILAAWALEADAVDRSVRILPGVRTMIDSLPTGRWAVATSGAKTYAHGCMNRVGITPPPVTITADDPRLTAGKPHPAPFLLAAECLGYDAARCVVFEDSPSGVLAGVASGAIVIAVCTSHEKDRLMGCGAHYIVDDMSMVTCEVVEIDGEEKLKFRVKYFMEGLLDPPTDARWIKSALHRMETSVPA